MTTNRMLTLAAIVVTATTLVYLSGFPHRRSRQTRVFITKIPNQTDAQAALATKYLREACPDMILIKDERRADYTVIARWLGTAWVLLVSRKDLPWMFFKQDSPDAIETFRQGCTAIRDDAKELADFDAHITPMPVGRYSLNSSNPDRVFLLDTKTGAVWELKPQPPGSAQEFERMSVEGLYNNLPLGVGQ